MITDKIIYLDATDKIFNIAPGSRLMALSNEQQLEVEALKKDSKVIEFKAASQSITEPTIEQPLQTKDFETVKKEESDPINLINPTVLEGTPVVNTQTILSDAASVNEPVINNPVNDSDDIIMNNVNNENLNPVIDLGSQVVTENVSEPTKEVSVDLEANNQVLQPTSSDNNEIMRGIMEINAERNKEIARLSKEIANVNALYDGKIISFINSKKKIMSEKELNNNSEDLVMNSPGTVVNDNIVVMPQNTMVSSEADQNLIDNQPNNVINLADQERLNNEDFARTLKVS